MKNDRMRALRKRRETSGLVPLRITEQWVTPEQRDALKAQILDLIEKTLKPA